MTAALLVTMPWDVLGSPSLALGILHQLLADRGIEVETLSVKLAWMEHLLREQAPIASPITITDYQDIACSAAGLGDWVFAEPPMAAASGIAAYRTHLRDRIDAGQLAKVDEMRRLAPAFLDACRDEILGREPRVVGFTTTFCQNMASLALARRLKEHRPELRIVFGGANCEGPMGAALQRAHPWVDVVVRGEGEAVVPDLVASLVAGAPPPRLPGLCYFEDGEQVVVANTPGVVVPMDSVPAPNYDDYFRALAGCSFGDTLASTVFLSYESARGCWWGEHAHCTFCGLNGANMAFRSKSPARVLEEVVGLVRRYHVLDLHAVDNILDHRHLAELLPAIARTGLDVELFYEVKSNLKKAQLAELRRCGVRRLQPGIESLSTPILGLMRKGVSAWQNVRFLKWCAELGIEPEWNIIYGFPGEPEGEYDRMAELLPALAHLPPPRMGPLGVHRFSPYHERPDEHGIEILGSARHYALLYDLEPAALADLAYEFAYRYADGRAPERYVGGCQQAVNHWERSHRAGASLTYRRGTGFLQVRDRRAEDGMTDYVLEGDEATLYLACDDGARLQTLCERTGIDRTRAVAILDSLVAEQLVFREGERYLGLAIGARHEPAPRLATMDDGDAGIDVDLVSLGRVRTSRLQTSR